MKKLVSQKADVVPDMMAGIVKAYPALKAVPHTNALISPQSSRQVYLLSGGGSGHEPLDFGYIGSGLLDGAIAGKPFEPPTAAQICRTVFAFPKPKPVLMIVKNFAGDVHHFKQAQAQLQAKGLKSALVVVSDDVSVNPETLETRRRGVAGTVLLLKLLGAAAQKNADLETLAALGKTVNQNLYTLGVALSGNALPGQTAPAFKLGAHEIDYGIGIHGEPGYRKETFQSSELLARELVNKLLQVSELPHGAHVAVLINGLGALPLMDQFVFTNDVCELLAIQQIKVDLVKVGNFLTAYNMSGVSLTLLRLVDPAWLNALKQPVGGFAWH